MEVFYEGIDDEKDQVRLKYYHENDYAPWPWK